MRVRQLGAGGLSVSRVGVGCNSFGTRMPDGEVRAVVDAAFDCGVTLFDTADVYGQGRSEELLGEALRGRRDAAVVATKFGADVGDGCDARGSRRHIRHAVDASLRRLGTGWIDLYQMHMPDPLTPLDETLAALDELVAEGKVRSIGSSNFEGWRIVDADWTARTAHRMRFVAAQNRYSLLDRRVEREVVPAALRCGVGVLPYFPLEMGLLTGKYRRGQPPPVGTRMGNAPDRYREVLSDRAFDAVEALERFAADRGRSLLDLAVGALAAMPAVASVIAGATSGAQVRANAAAAQWEPDAAGMAALRDLLDEHALRR